MRRSPVAPYPKGPCTQIGSVKGSFKGTIRVPFRGVSELITRPDLKSEDSEDLFDSLGTPKARGFTFRVSVSGLGFRVRAFSLMGD